MKKILLIILTVSAVIFAGLPARARAGQPSGKITAYYFHGVFRCPTCINMEKYSREAIEKNFKDELASGALEFKAVNVEEEGNEHFTQDYQLYTKALILSLAKDGQEVKFRNLDKIWLFARDKQKFIDYVARELSEFMEDTE